MKNVFKKTLCLLSSAVLLCGASSMTASAKRIPADILDGRLTDITDIAEPDKLVDIGNKARNFGYYLNGYNFDITPSETATLEAKTDRIIDKYTDVEYQWYRNNKAIDGATKKTYSASSAGEYYCEIKEYSIFSAAKTTTITSTSFTPRGTYVAPKTTTTVSTSFTPRGTHVTPKTTSTTHSEFQFAGTGIAKVTTSSGDRVALDFGEIYAPLVTTTAPQFSIRPVEKFTTPKATVKEVQELSIASQSSKYQLLQYNTILFVNPTGGSGIYYYTWKKDGKQIGKSQYQPAPNIGVYICEVSDSRGRKVESEPISVYKNSDMTINYVNYPIYNLSFQESDKPNATITIKIEAYSGTGKYSYNWQKYINGQWVNIDYHSESLTLRKDAIADHESRYASKSLGGNQYIIQHMKYNDYRCIVNSLNYYGDTLETKTTSTIQVNALLDHYVGYWY